MDLETKKRKYLQACRIMDMFNQKHNLCGIRKNESGETTCNGCLKHQKGLCCRFCSHLTDNGCNTQSIGCKLNYCYIGYTLKQNGLVKSNNDPIAKRFKLLKTIIVDYFNKNNVPYRFVRASMEDIFRYEAWYEDRNLYKKYGFDSWNSRFIKKGEGDKIPLSEEELAIFDKEVEEYYKNLD